MNKRTRSNMYSFYLSDEEATIFDEKLKLAGNISRSDFLRKLILYGCIYQLDTSYLNEYNHQIAAIGNNINQIAMNTNSNKETTLDELKKTREELEKIWQLQKSILLQNPSLSQLLTSANQSKQ